ncbi:MAG: endonuclease/exonuclease/phosphatase family protein [Nitriliruptoraceae bacterium]
MRLVAYNVSGGLDPGAVGEVLAAIGPEVACLTEAPGGGRLRTLARSAGLEVVARTGRRGSGTAILADSAVRVRATSQVPLITPRDVPTREATHAILGVGGLGVSVTAVQFGLRPEVRRMNLDELLAFLATIDLPSIIGCDLNESVRSPVAGAFASRYLDAHAVAGTGAGATYPTSDASTRQDFVFVDPALEVTASWVPTDAPVDAASHHRPVVAEVSVSADVAPPAAGPST